MWRLLILFLDCAPFLKGNSNYLSNRQQTYQHLKEVQQMKGKVFCLMTAFIILTQLVLPPSMAFADSPPNAEYEMMDWRFGAQGDARGVTIAYKGSDGIILTVSFPMSKDDVNGHEDDPVWKGIDSAAPFLAFVNRHGITSNDASPLRSQI